MQLKPTKKHKLNFRDYFFLHQVNFVVRILIVSDILLVGAGGLLAPIFALFLDDYIQGADAAVAGIAASIYYFIKAVLQIPAASFMDKIRGEMDDFYFLFVFSVIIAAFPILYLFIHTPMQLYIMQFLFGIMTAFTYPSFMGIFTRHIDHKKEGLEWGMYFSFTDIASASFGAIGGTIAVTLGYEFVILSMVTLSLIGAFLLFTIRPYMKRR